MQVETGIAQVRVLTGFLGRQRIEIRRTLCGPRFGAGLNPVAFDKPIGMGRWRKARADDMPEVNVWMSVAGK